MNNCERVAAVPPRSFQKRRYARSRNPLNGAAILAVPPLESSMLRSGNGGTPSVNGSFSPPCKGGVAAPSRKRSHSEKARTGWSLGSHASQCILKHLRVSDDPVCGASVASRLSIDAAATPPSQGGECARIKHSGNSFTSPHEEGNMRPAHTFEQNLQNRIKSQDADPTGIQPGAGCSDRAGEG